LKELFSDDKNGQHLQHMNDEYWKAQQGAEDWVKKAVSEIHTNTSPSLEYEGQLKLNIRKGVNG